MKSSNLGLRRLYATLAFTCSVWLLSSLVHSQDDVSVPFEISGKTMGPIAYKVVIADHPDSVTPIELQERVAEVLENINQLMSTYQPESDVSRFNRSQSTEFQTVDPKTAAVVARAIEISKLTEGAFDITVGPAVNLWDFGPKNLDFKIPTVSQTDAIKSSIGYQYLEVQLNPPAISKRVAAVNIDLSAIAKGYAVDQVATAMDDLGCKNFLVEVGGEVFASGERFSGGNWRIGVERPDDAGITLGNIAEISDEAMATSGDYRNFHELGGIRYSHTIDPKTCRPVKHTLASACIIFKDCMTADALATAMMVMGKNRGEQLCQELGAEYLLVERESDFGDELTEFKSKSFPLLDAPQPNNSPTILQQILPVFIGAVVIFGLVIISMSVGAIFAKKPITGSCGGLANQTNEYGETSCGICSKPTTDCVEKNA
ncbi:FAD:protein FMN transferase [Mariniblastus sp.]|nr:FAD:protein FMN transferase [Mariniblastus sp.]